MYWLEDLYYILHIIGICRSVILFLTLSHSMKTMASTAPMTNSRKAVNVSSMPSGYSSACSQSPVAATGEPSHLRYILWLTPVMTMWLMLRNNNRGVSGQIRLYFSKWVEWMWSYVGSCNVSHIVKNKQGRVMRSHM